MGLFSRKNKELTQADKDLLLIVLKRDKIQWELSFPFPCFNINRAIENVENGKELDSEDIESCKNAIKRYLSNVNVSSNDKKAVKELKKKF